ncbi:MAG: transcriptional regulator [Clostridiales bacterium GWF2_38_85]|nr:MAG: transcriptional regulator [Clostridiales bacterium GWF2_38_85]HBL84360.1 YafY family transcriptional regulator [Clostridiales bacterium]
MQINRLFEIIYILLNKKTITAKELAERFGVSQRTIYRDVDTLSLAGIPVYTEKGKGGGISLLPDYVLNKSILSEQEQNEILSALQGLSSVKTSETDQVLQKLSTIFNKNTVRWLEVDFSDWSFANGKTFSDFKTAILERRIAEFDYFSTYGEMTHRRIEPIQLWFKSKSWYIKGFCLMRQDIRLFKLSRVRNLAVADEQFSERDYLASPPTPAPANHQKPDVTIKLKIAPEMTYRVYDEFDEALAEKQPDGSFVVSVTWPEDDWVYGTILSYGEYIEVLEPEHIREIINEKSQKTAKKYL